MPENPWIVIDVDECEKMTDEELKTWLQEQLKRGPNGVDTIASA